MIKPAVLIQDMLSGKEIEQIHKASLNLLEETGVKISHKEARQTLQQHGAKVKGEHVYIPRSMVNEAVKKSPTSFTLHARNPKNNLEIGSEKSMLAPGFGAPFVTDVDQGRRRATFTDYVNFTKLGAASEHIDLLGGVLVEPDDIPEEKRHAKMLYAGAKYSDKCLMGIGEGKEKIRDCFKMASIIFGEDEIITNKPVLLTVAGATSPLQYHEAALVTLMEYAKYNQAISIYSQIMAGTTGPVSLAGSLTLQNVEILTGITLAQMINPGTPVIYGSASTIADMKTAELTVGNPEYAKFVGGTKQLAQYYDLPCKAGGAHTDSLLVDAQTGYESMFTLMSAVNYGVDLILFSAGILEDFMTMSYEKFIVDSQILEQIKTYQSGIEVNKTEMVKEVTAKINSQFSKKSNYNSKVELISTDEQANKRWKQILADFEAPYLNPVIEDKLVDYIKNKC